MHLFVFFEIPPSREGLGAGLRGANLKACGFERRDLRICDHPCEGCIKWGCAADGLVPEPVER